MFDLKFSARSRMSCSLSISMVCLEFNLVLKIFILSWIKALRRIGVGKY